ncbi:glycosyl transferase family protein [Azospirillum argentinense]|uniref:Glycosyl transferase family protein n=1 Tax=Azospirillum brasilense TaxID=192 RepID=A0A4D8Q4T0_AZOBR|nr:glycosyl transferase family protein [Azospirillum argentinense]QCO03576.1 glycosyl transferase family protein [Azospirillum argentinense]
MMDKRKGAAPRPAPVPEASAQGKAAAGGQENRLSRGRLIVALDALLSKRNVTLAARDLGLQTSALSRLLAQMREEFGDPLFIRSGRGLVPTPFAEALRPRVQALARGIDALFEPSMERPVLDETFDPRWNVPTAIDAPPLQVRPAGLLEGQPSPAQIDAKLERIAPDATAQDRLARHIGVLGIAGGGHGRPLTAEEAEEAMTIILAGEADPVQVGALLGMMRMRGSTAPELAGLVRAMRAHVAAGLGRTIQADIDWPCFTSPNYHNPPWFFHAARLVAQAGHRVLLHGSTGCSAASGRYEFIAPTVGIPVCTNAREIAAALAAQRIAYAPLAALSPQIYRLIGLHRLTQTRSAVFEAVHLLKPSKAKTSLLGAAKPTYRELHRDAARILGWKHMAVLGSVRDVAQFTPFRPSSIHRLVNGEAEDLILPACMDEPPPTPRPRGTSLEYWQGVWTGAVRDARAERIIIGTAAFALFTLPGATGPAFTDALRLAEQLWKARLGQGAMAVQIPP